MVLYLSIIFVAVILITLFNSLFNQPLFNCSPVSIFLVVILGVIIEIAIDGVVAFVVHSMPNRFFDKDKKLFKVSRKERKFYEKLHIKSWKDKVLELGILGGFRKNKLNEPNSSKYLERFIIESNKGLVGHVLGILFGFLILLYPNFNFFLCLGLPIAFVNIFLNCLSSMILRYNIPKLTVAYERAKKNETLLKEKERDNENK